MITKVTEQNSYQYEKLFIEAESLLKTYLEIEDKITSLQQYFMAFPNIIRAAEMKDKSSENQTGDIEYYQKYFAILPLDEPVFEINADTRVITIPTQFKSVGVVGDDIAELIFFSIDRFFDAVDFGSPEIEALIEWHRTSGEDQEPHADRAYIKELTLRDNKILIGWSITGQVAEEAGTIEFAIRLIKRNNNGEIIYSFSTSAAKININKTLNFYPEITEVDNRAARQILDRILNSSSPDLSGENSLNAPSYTKILEDETIVSTNIDAMTDINGKQITYAYKSNDEFYADLDKDGILIASVTARSTNGNQQDRLLYRWYKYDQKDKIWNAYNGSDYAIDGNNVIINNTTGKFKCVAMDYAGLRSAKKDSQILYILGPEEPEVKVAETGKYIPIILNNKADGETLTVLPKNENGFYATDYDKNNSTHLTYTWKKRSDIENEAEIIVENIDSPEYKAIEEGYYYGYAQTERNKETKTSVDATTYRVTEPLDIPTEYYTISGIEYPTALQGIVGQTITIDFHTFFENGDIDKEYKCDKIKYKWFRAENDLGDEFKPVDGIGSQNETADKIIHFKPSVRGYYTVKLLINRNGQTLPENNFDEEDPSTWYQLQKIYDGKSVPLTIKMADEKN